MTLLTKDPYTGKLIDVRKIIQYAKNPPARNTKYLESTGFAYLDEHFGLPYVLAYKAKELERGSVRRNMNLEELIGRKNKLEEGLELMLADCTSCPSFFGDRITCPCTCGRDLAIRDTIKELGEIEEKISKAGSQKRIVY